MPTQEVQTGVQAERDRSTHWRGGIAAGGQPPAPRRPPVRRLPRSARARGSDGASISARIHSAALRQRAKDEHETIETLPAPRGTITDRDGVVLAVSEPADEVSADPDLIAEPLADSRQLAPLLGESSSAVLAKLSQRAGFVYLAHALPAKEAEQIAALEIEGIEETPVTNACIRGARSRRRCSARLAPRGRRTAGLEYSENKLLSGVQGNRVS